MKPIFTLLAVFLSIYIQAQTDSLKKYVVDYKLEYDAIYPQDSTKNYKAIYYIGSTANNFFATAKPDKEGKLKLYFRDNDGRSFNGNVTPDDLASIEKISIAQKAFYEFSNPYKYQINNYDYFATGDSIVNGRKCSGYSLRSTKPKREKRKKLIHEMYYIDTTTKMLPLLIEPTAYEIWKARKNISNGLLVQKDAFKIDGTLFYTEKLVHVTPVDFTITLIGDTTTVYRIDVH
ncbi:hypothetical protein ACLI09_15350 [Flavobacterium sp. RHBU_24]|uniref:hypothetical protein n=1 Tax=Flavobacterium sp. RHBU_24 TaxID=3391185 RepID=UPI003984E556